MGRREMKWMNGSQRNEVDEWVIMKQTTVDVSLLLYECVCVQGYEYMN